MTLDNAISDALGKSTYVRRQAWGNNGVLSIMPTETGPLHQLIGPVMGNLRFVAEHPARVDYDAEDWTPCDVGGGPIGCDWSQLLQVAGLTRGNPCNLRFADEAIQGPPLTGDWRFVWLIPDAIWLSADVDCPPNWLEPGRNLDVTIAISGAEGELPFQLLGAEIVETNEGRRVYRLTVHEYPQR